MEVYTVTDSYFCLLFPLFRRLIRVSRYVWSPVTRKKVGVQFVPRLQMELGSQQTTALDLIRQSCETAMSCIQIPASQYYVNSCTCIAWYCVSNDKMQVFFGDLL